MVERVYTPEEANAALEQVRPLAERMVEHYRRLAEAHDRRAALGRKVAGNGGGIDSGAAQAMHEDAEREGREVTSCLQALNELGVLVKDVGTGLLDFPSLRDGEDVLLCWRVGEPEVAYWHGPEDGFAGRRPLPL